MDIHNKDGCCALVRAAKYGNEEIVKLIVQYGAEVDIKSYNGNTPLIKASEAGHEGIVKFLLDR